MSNSVSLFGYELIRNEVLKNILGKNANELLYWAGKEIARNHKVETQEGLVDFFKETSWGNLVLTKQTKDGLVFELTGDVVENRIMNNDDAEFNIETGFLAAQTELSIKKSTDAIYEINKRKKLVKIKVISDMKEDV